MKDKELVERTEELVRAQAIHHNLNHTPGNNEPYAEINRHCRGYSGGARGRTGISTGLNPRASLDVEYLCAAENTFDCGISNRRAGRRAGAETGVRRQQLTQRC